jgi:hypothetical protein
MPTRIIRAALAALLLVGTAALAQQLSPNAGSFVGEGQLNDHDGNKGTWLANGALREGRFTGTMSVVLGGKRLTVTLQPGPAYLENGFCVLKGENGRNRVELRGKCDRSKFGPGTIAGYFDRDRSFNGEFSGRLAWGGAVPASTAEVLPTARLNCGFRERVGGVVAGQLADYENRPSLMGFLSLTPDGTYRTQNGTGGFRRNGDTIRFTSGSYAGALGRLRPDNSGEAAIYFSLDENRRANGTPIVDPWSTFCVHAR